MSVHEHTTKNTAQSVEKGKKADWNENGRHIRLLVGTWRRKLDKIKRIIENAATSLQSPGPTTATKRAPLIPRHWRCAYYPGDLCAKRLTQSPYTIQEHRYKLTIQAILVNDQFKTYINRAIQKSKTRKLTKTDEVPSEAFKRYYKISWRYYRLSAKNVGSWDT